MLLLLLLLHVLFHELLNLLLLLLPDLPVIEAPLRLSLCLEPRHGTAQGWRGAGEPGEMACLCRWYKTRVFSFMYSCSCGLLWLVQCIIWPTSPAGTKSCELVYKASNFLVDVDGDLHFRVLYISQQPSRFQITTSSGTISQSIEHANLNLTKPGPRVHGTP